MSVFSNAVKSNRLELLGVNSVHTLLRLTKSTEKKDRMWITNLGTIIGLDLENYYLLYYRVR